MHMENFWLGPCIATHINDFTSKGLTKSYSSHLLFTVYFLSLTQIESIPFVLVNKLRNKWYICITPKTISLEVFPG